MSGTADWGWSLVTPPLGRAIGYFDYKSQEYGVAAYLSGDRHMIADYEGGEVYLPLGVRSGLIPPDATKQTHGEFRDKVLKPILPGLQYGRQPPGIALAIATEIQPRIVRTSPWRSGYIASIERRTQRFGAGWMPSHRMRT